MRRLLVAGAVASAMALASVLPAAAQEFGVTQSPILTVDQDRLYTGSDYGARVRTLIKEVSVALSAENRQIEAELIAEEQALTDQRPSLPPQEFRALADAFDEKVQGIRAEQDAKSRKLAQQDDVIRQQFYRRIVGILGELVRERGAVAIVERRSIFLAIDTIDITDAAIAQINIVMDADSLIELPEISMPTSPDPEE